jgi:hypothetical protein
MELAIRLFITRAVEVGHMGNKQQEQRDGSRREAALEYGEVRIFVQGQPPAWTRTTGTPDA